MFLVLYAFLTWWMSVAAAQRAPCYHCEMYKDSHPHSHPYSSVRAHCMYPCGCDSMPKCPTGVPVIRDGCGCCWQCARIAGEQCDGVTLCDTSKGLSCRYNSSADAKGVCKEVVSAKCQVNNSVYEDGQSFTIDCRTQCVCQNGTYACVSLCPGESIPPSAQCQHPHLVSVPGQCCREWMCDTAPDKVVEPPACNRESGQWSKCSVQTCGVGVSVRWSTDNSRCQLVNQTRLCQLRPCRRDSFPSIYQFQNIDKHVSRKHHIRRGHTCKATQRTVQSVRLQVGWCISERRYRPKQCGACPNRCCSVYSSTTITVAFLCPLHSNTDLLAGRRRTRDLLLEKSRVDYMEETVVTTRAPSVYDMMDEGQPVLDESLIYHDQQEPLGLLQQHQQEAATAEEAFLYNYPGYYKYNAEGHTKDNQDDEEETRNRNIAAGNVEDQADLVYLVSYNNENLTVEDDSAYERIRKDNYKIVHHRVQWILRCKCRPTCNETTITTTSPIPEGDLPQGTPSPPGT